MRQARQAIEGGRDEHHSGHRRTGTLGRLVVAELLKAGHTTRVASRHPRPAGPAGPTQWAAVDYRTAAGIADATADVDAIVHCAASPLHEEDLLRAIAVHSTSRHAHLIYISIVGVDAIPFSYYRHKLAAERVAENSAMPWTVLRATQFHELVRSALSGLSHSPVLPLLADVPLQPIAAAEVAHRLAELAAGEPQGRVPDIGGPEVLPMSALAQQFQEMTGTSRRTVSLRLPGRLMQALRDGHLVTPENRYGTQTFAEFLRSATRR